MFFINTLPYVFKILYMLMGVVQFLSIPSTISSKFYTRLWMLPMCVAFFYIFIQWATNNIQPPKTLLNFSPKIFSGFANVGFTVSLITGIFSLIIFYRRNNTLRKLLIELDNIYFIISKSQDAIKVYDKFDIVLILMKISTFLVICYVDPNNFAMMFLIPSMLGINQIFLNNILAFARYQFQIINQQLSGFNIFSSKILTNLNKKLQITCIDNLSLLHCDLVNLCLKINKLFEITTTISMAFCFSVIILLLYILIFLIAHSELTLEAVVIISAIIYSIVYYFLWLVFTIRNYTLTQETVSVLYNT